MPEIDVLEIMVFLLAGITGFLIISRVPSLLHTPLMSATNAISAISIVGSLVLAGAAHEGLVHPLVPTVLGTIAVTAAMTNVVGGFMITERMLRMFKQDQRAKPAAKAEGKKA